MQLPTSNAQLKSGLQIQQKFMMDSPNKSDNVRSKSYILPMRINVWELDAYLATGNEKSSKLFFCNLSQVANHQDWSAISL